jgi:malonate transporter
VHIEGFELFLFKIAIPCYLFGKIANSNFFEVINLAYLFSYIVVFLIISIISYLYFFKEQNIANICIKILASGYVNAAIYNIPIITILLGDPSAAVIGNIIQVVVIQPVFIMVLYQAKHKEGSMAKKLIKSITTPLVILPLLGILISYYEVKLPDTIILIFENIGFGASNISLFVLGLNISKFKIKFIDLDRSTLYILTTKNILHPVIAFFIGKYLFTLKSYWLAALVISTAAPTAFLVYLIAKKFDIEVNLIRNVMVQSMLLSLFTLGIIVFLLTIYS